MMLTRCQLSYVNIRLIQNVCVRESKNIRSTWRQTWITTPARSFFRKPDDKFKMHDVLNK